MMKTPWFPFPFRPVLFLLLLALTRVGHAEALIAIPFAADNAGVIKNLGKLPDGKLARAGRPLPRLIAPGVGGQGFAVEFTNEQTGRPDYHQSIEIPSEGLNNLKQWTLSLWVKVDETKYNSSNNVSTRTTVFATRDGMAAPEAAGIYLGMTKGAEGPQLEIQLGDGTEGAVAFYNFASRANILDGKWTFISLNFDAARTEQKLRVYGGDETRATEEVAVSTVFNRVTGTGVAAGGVISIGDGLGGFGPFSSLNGAVDNIHLTPKALTQEEIEALRQAAVKKNTRQLP